MGQRHVAPHLCRVLCANGCPGGFCVSEKDCGDGSDEKTCPEPAGQCIEAHAPSPLDPQLASGRLPGPPGAPLPKLLGCEGKAKRKVRAESTEGERKQRKGNSGDGEEMTEKWGQEPQDLMRESVRDADPAGKEAGTQPKGDSQTRLLKRPGTVEGGLVAAPTRPRKQDVHSVTFRCPPEAPRPSQLQAVPLVSRARRAQASDAHAQGGA